MNKRVIKSILKSKLNKWLASIEDESVRKLAAANTILTGGAIANLLLKEEIKDFDLYFRDEATTVAVANYYVKKFNEKHPNVNARVAIKDPDQVCDERRVKIVIESRGVASENQDILKAPFEDAVEALEDADSVDASTLEKEPENYRPVFLSSNAITLSGKIQLVVRFFGEPEEIHKNYDFVHCTNYYDLSKNEVTLLPAAMEALLAKELRYVGSKYPLCSVIRTRKFLKRGFHINAGQYLKMIMQLNELDLSNVKVLEEQLVGVDSNYFNMLIDALKLKQEKDPNYVIENTYVASIIDKIF